MVRSFEDIKPLVKSFDEIGEGGEFKGAGVTGEWEGPGLLQRAVNYENQLYGSFMDNWMLLGRASLGLAGHKVRQLKLLPMANIASDILTEQDPERKKWLLNRMADIEQTYNNFSKKLLETQKVHQIGREIILKNHPEWESDPPESFIDLLTSPKKAGIALAGSLPVLLSAGIFTAAGQPQIGAALMYATEGQNAYDEAIAYGASEDDAEMAYVIYGSVSAALEQMQLQGVIKIGKGAFNHILNRTTQKIAKQGLKSLTYEAMIVAAQEALEEMSQGTWQEITAKMIYDKSIPGGLRGFIDRRLQEGYLGALMGWIPAAGGAVAGKVVGHTPFTNKIRHKTIERMAEPEVELPPMHPSTTKKITDVHNETGESVINLETGELTTKGYAVAVPEAVEYTLDTNKTTQEDVEAYAKEHADILTRDNRNTIITRTENGKTIFDIATIVPTKQQAVKLAKQVDQRAAYNLRKNESVPVPPKKISKKRALHIGHDLADTLGFDEQQRRQFMAETTGKQSMADMSIDEMRNYVSTLKQHARKAGVEYKEKPSPVEQLVAQLETIKKRPKEIQRTGIYKALHATKKGIYTAAHSLMRLERFFESLDGHKEGLHYQFISQAVNKATGELNANSSRLIAEFLSYLEEQMGIDTALWIAKQDDIPGTGLKLSASQRIGIYMLSQNKHGLRRLVKIMGYSHKDIQTTKQFMSEQETQIAEWLLDQYEAQWNIIVQAAKEAGIDPEKLKKEWKYAPLLRTDIDLELQTDFLDDLIGEFVGEKLAPEAGMLEKRKPKAAGEVELDAFVCYMHNITRVQRFISMAPVAKRVGKIINSKKWQQAINARTYGQGSKLVHKWLKDAIKGSGDPITDQLGKMLAIMRRNGIVYAIGYNVPSALRQTLSGFQAMAVDPHMQIYVPLNMIKASTPKGYKAMEQFVYDRSPEMKYRNYDRDLRSRHNKKAIEKKLKHKISWSERATKWIRWMDKHTVVVVWKSFYDVLSKLNTVEQFKNFGVSEEEAATFIEKGIPEQRKIELADKWVGRTQPMASAKDLPHFFRGGNLEKILSAFQNQINNNGNFHMYDILGARKAGQISNTTTAYRIMWSYVFPAIAMGMIGRGRPLRSWEELAVDLSTYPIFPLVWVGRIFDRIIRGWGQSGTIVEAGPEAFVKFGRAAKKGNIQEMIKYAAQTIGAFTGIPPAQAIRTTEGAIDLVAGTTKDPRRLIYGKWSLEQGTQTDEKYKPSRKR